MKNPLLGDQQTTNSPRLPRAPPKPTKQARLTQREHDLEQILTVNTTRMQAAPMGRMRNEGTTPSSTPDRTRTGLDVASSPTQMRGNNYVQAPQLIRGVSPSKTSAISPRLGAGVTIDNAPLIGNDGLDSQRVVTGTPSSPRPIIKPHRLAAMNHSRSPKKVSFEDWSGEDSSNSDISPSSSLDCRVTRSCPVPNLTVGSSPITSTDYIDMCLKSKSSLDRCRQRRKPLPQGSDIFSKILDSEAEDDESVTDSDLRINLSDSDDEDIQNGDRLFVRRRSKSLSPLRHRKQLEQKASNLVSRNDLILLAVDSDCECDNVNEDKMAKWRSLSPLPTHEIRPAIGSPRQTTRPRPRTSPRPGTPIYHSPSTPRRVLVKLPPISKDVLNES